MKFLESFKMSQMFCILSVPLQWSVMENEIYKRKWNDVNCERVGYENKKIEIIIKSNFSHW